MTNIISPESIKNYLDRFVVGQDKAKKDLAILGFYQLMRQYIETDDYNDMIEEEYQKRYQALQEIDNSLYTQKHDDGTVTSYSLVSNKDDLMKKLREEYTFSKYIVETEPSLTCQNSLILGPSGCGKTYLIKLLAKGIGLPIHYINAKDLTNTGYIGNTFAELLNNSVNTYLEANTFTADQLSFSIVFIDEFDKICSKDDGSGSWNSGLQSSLLLALEGAAARDKSFGSGSIKISTNRFMFVLGGSFHTMREQKHKTGKGIGYNAKVSGMDTCEYDYSHSDLEQAGVLREIAGRLPVVTEVLSLTGDQLKEALTKENSILEPYKKLYKALGREFIFYENKIDEIVQECLKTKTGARGLRTGLHNVYKDELYGLEKHVDNDE